MTTTITIDKQFHNLWRACARDDSRPVLAAIYIDPAGKAVASSGYILAVVPAAISGDPLPESGVLIGADLWQLSLRCSKGDAVLTFDGNLTITGGGDLKVSGSRVIGTYPNWRNLLESAAIKDGDPGVVAFQPQLAATLAAALGVDMPILRTRATSASPLWVYAGGGLGIMMPMAGSHETWAGGLPPRSEAHTPALQP